MQNSYIKMYDNIYHFSLGNLFRVIKENSNIKRAALQTELFCTLFNIEDINETTVNNYCTGYRAINDDYKQVYISYRKNYLDNNLVLTDILTNLLSIIEGIIVRSETNRESLKLINDNNKLQKICIDLYNIAKNDVCIPEDLLNKLRKYIKESNLYDFMCESLFFIVIDKKQPVYENEEIVETIEQFLKNTALSMNDIKEILKFSLTDGVWSIRGLRELAKKENPVACFQLGSLEFNGEITGTPRYSIAYKYLEIAARKDHPSANWMLGVIHTNSFVNLKPDYDLAWYYFKKSEELGCVAALNSIGICFQNGTVPNRKVNIKKAIEYFKMAADKDYIYAYNNLGKIYEQQKEYDRALEQFLKSANQGESWAANKVGEYYRTGTGCVINLEKAFNYYQISLQSTSAETNPWCFYNLAKYFYQYGCKEIGLEPDIKKALELYQESSKRGIKEADDMIKIINNS